MGRYFRAQLTIILIVFSLFISIIIVAFDFAKLNEEIHANYELKVEVAEEIIVHAINTVEKVYDLVDSEAVEVMENYTAQLIAKYEETSDFSTWDFDALEDEWGMRVYVINEENIIEYASYNRDLGLDFNLCCKRLVKVFNSRRNTGNFYHDDLDVQQSDGEIMKYTYQATPDEKYILELGKPLTNDPLFQQFNFLETIQVLENTYDEIISINVYTRTGVLVGNGEEKGLPQKIDINLMPYLQSAYDQKESQQVVKEVEGRDLTHKYIPYFLSEENRVVKRVIEIIYDNGKLDNILSYYKDRMLLQTFIIIIGSIILSYILARLVAKPIYLAFHDSLTRLKNRAAFEDIVRRLIRKKATHLTLMIIDLDNFKLINDRLGHLEGDRILKATARIIEEEIGVKQTAARLGGDEFITAFVEYELAEVTTIARKIVEKINKELYSICEVNDKEIDVSVSIGIARIEEGDSFSTLYDRSDKALYQSKENGKNQFTVYEK